MVDFFIGYKQHLNVGVRLVDRWSSLCERIAIGGSLRRGKVAPKDIEIVAIQRENQLLDLLDSWLEQGVARRVKTESGRNAAWGQKHRFFEVQDARTQKWFTVDLYLTDVERWPIYYTLRTGDADVSKMMVTQRGNGGWLGNHYAVMDNLLWHFPKSLAGLPSDYYRDIIADAGARAHYGVTNIQLKSPIGFFEACDLPYIRPSFRNLKYMQQWAKLPVRGLLYALRGWEIESELIEDGYPVIYFKRAVSSSKKRKGTMPRKGTWYQIEVKIDPALKDDKEAYSRVVRSREALMQFEVSRKKFQTIQPGVQRLQLPPLTIYQEFPGETKIAISAESMLLNAWETGRYHEGWLVEADEHGTEVYSPDDHYTGRSMKLLIAEMKRGKHGIIKSNRS